MSLHLVHVAAVVSGYADTSIGVVVDECVIVELLTI